MTKLTVLLYRYLFALIQWVSFSDYTHEVIIK
ncbi:hypothetical protein BQ6471_02658 [Vibrio gazogenes]|nr:hypothetical protein BQ6471_02658 [Vibrio gazogenes]